jgi:hypothetical protein
MNTVDSWKEDLAQTILQDKWGGTGAIPLCCHREEEKTQRVRKKNLLCQGRYLCKQIS